MAANSWEGLIAHWDARLRQAFLQAVQQMRSAAEIDQIARMLERGDVNGAVRAVGLDPTQFRVWDREFEAAFEAGGVVTTRLIPSIRDAQGFRVTVQFNVRNPAAESWLRSHSSEAVKEILDDQRQMIRGYLEAGLAKGVNPRTAALDLVGRVAASGNREGGVIGLTNSQAEWVRAYEAELASDKPLAALQRTLRDKRFDGAVRLAAKEDRPVAAELRAKMVTAYLNRALRFRAEAIARTEAMAALHQAQEEAIGQAVAAGGVSSSAVKFVWNTARDARVRDTHRSMDGQERRQGEYFVTGSGARLRYPGDPNGPASEIINCRCFREPRVDFLAGVR